MKEELNIILSLEAPTRQALSGLTVKVQLNVGMKLHFFDFAQQKNGKWVCWYEMPYLIYAEKAANGEA